MSNNNCEQDTNINNVNIILNYYKESLKYDLISRLEFDKDTQFIDEETSIMKSKKLDYFFFTTKNYKSIYPIFKYCLQVNRELFYKKNIQADDSFKFFYAPIMILFKNNIKENKYKYFAPFFIEIKDQCDLDKHYKKKGKKVTTNLRRFLNASNLLHNIGILQKDQGKIDNFNNIVQQDIFGHSAFEISPKLYEKPFELISEEFLDNFRIKIEKRGIRNQIETYNKLKEIMDIFFTIYFNNKEGYDSLKEKVKYFISSLQEACGDIKEKKYKLNIIPSETQYNCIFVVNMNEIETSENYTAGILKLYNQILNDKMISRNNLLYKFFSDPSSLNRDNYKEKKENKYRFLQLSLKKRLELQKKQLGAFDTKYPLTSSQRYCLQVSKTNLDIIPVNGPPGTGKTSLLRAFFADYTIENAINVIAQYENKEINEKKPFAQINFFPPLVSFSTNTQAQQNIVKGISDGFLDFKKKGEYYTRWLNPKIELKESVTIEDFKLYVPMLKTTINKNEKIITINILEDIKNDIIVNLNEYITNYLYLSKNSLCIDMDIKEINKRRLLEKVFNLLRKKIEIIKNNIYKSLNMEIEEKFINFENNLKLLEKIAILQNNRELLRDVKKNVKNKKEMFEIIEKLKPALSAIKNSIEQYDDQSETIEKEFFNKLDKLKQGAVDKKNMIESKVNNESKEDIAILVNKERELTKILQNASANLKTINKKIRDLENSVFLKITNFMHRKYTKTYERLNAEKEKIENILRNVSIDIQYNYDDINNIKKQSKSLLFEKYKEIDLYCSFEKNRIEKEYNEKLNTLKKKTEEIIFIYGYNSFAEAKEAIGLYNSIENNYIGFEDVLEDSEKINCKLDAERAELFFTSIHLLEASLLLKLYDKDLYNIKRRCPICNKNGVVESSNDGTFLFHKGDCGFKMTKYKKFTDKNRDDILMTDSEVEKILFFKTIVYDYTTFELVKNEKEKGWFNVLENNKVHQIDYGMLNDLSTIFPLLNTTAHSFFGVFSIYNMAIRKKILPESYFKYLIVDEAGMVLPSLLVNIYAGKKILLFGDSKQIQPVYPFMGNNITNNIIMDKYTKSIEQRDILLDKYSLLQQSSMTIANRTILIEDKNATRADDNAPLWLLQHFRCAKPIIEYCNKIVYNGKIEPQIEEDENWKHLDFINHNFDMNMNNNTNEKEADLILDIIKKLIDKNIAIEDIGIITPYRNQSFLIQNKLKYSNIDIEKLYVGTIHKFQGSERKIIIFSTSSGKNYTGKSKDLFMNKDSGNMLNVAVSRAKKTFILVGNEEAISDSDSYSGKLVMHIKNYVNKKNENNNE